MIVIVRAEIATWNHEPQMNELRTKPETVPNISCKCNVFFLIQDLEFIELSQSSWVAFFKLLFIIISAVL